MLNEEVKLWSRESILVFDRVHAELLFFRFEKQFYFMKESSSVNVLNKALGLWSFVLEACIIYTLGLCSFSGL